MQGHNHLSEEELIQRTQQLVMLNPERKDSEITDEFMFELGRVLTRKISAKDNTQRFTKKTLTKIVFTVMAAPAGWPFKGLAYQFAKGNEAYGSLLEGGTVTCYANVCYWSYMGLIDEVFEQNRSLDSVLDRTNATKARRWLVPFVFGCLTSVPSLYLAYMYNNEDVIWPIINFTSSIGYRVFGFSKGINLIAHYFKWRSRNTPAHQFIKALISDCHSTRRSIRLLNSVKVSDLISLNSKSELIIDINQLIKRLKDTNKNNPAALSPNQQSIQYFGKFVGCALPAAQISLNAVLSFGAYDLISSNIIFRILMSAITLFPDASLMIISAMMMVSNMFDLAFGAYNHSDSGRNPIYYNIKLAMLLYSLVLFVSSFSYGANAFAIEDNFEANVSAGLLPLFILADTLFHVYVLSNNSSRTIDQVTEITGDDDKKRILAESRMLEQFEDILENLSDEKCNKLFNEFNEAMEIESNKDKLQVVDVTGVPLESMESNYDSSSNEAEINNERHPINPGSYKSIRFYRPAQSPVNAPTITPQKTAVTFTN